MLLVRWIAIAGLGAVACTTTPAPSAAECTDDVLQANGACAATLATGQTLPGPIVADDANVYWANAGAGPSSPRPSARRPSRRGP